MSGVISYLRDIIMLTERIGELRDEVQELRKDHEETRARLRVIEILIERASSTRLPPPRL